MNILMLGRWLPPPRRPVRATREYQFARHLARSHRLTLAFITDTPDAVGAISALRTEFGDLEFAAVPRRWKSLVSAIRLATGESCTLSYFRSEALRTRLADRLRRTRYDLVLVSSSSMIQYALDLDPAVPMIVDFGAVDSEWWLRQAARGTFGAARFFRTEAARLRTAEAAAARRAVRCLAETPEAARIVQSLAPGGPTTVISDGVDVEAFGSLPSTGDVPTVVFSTSLASGPEMDQAIDGYRAIVLAVRACVPQARFVLSTRCPLANGRPAADLALFDIVGPPTDLRVLFHDRAVAVAPLRSASDIRTGVLEPMAAGIPVVTTSLVGGHLGAEPGSDLEVADTALDLARHIGHLLLDPARRAALGARGRLFVSSRHEWSALTRRLTEIVDAVAKPSSAATGHEPAAVTKVHP